MGDDTRTYTFSLRDNARWQDGTPITSRDVMFSLNSMIDKASVLDKDGNSILAEHGRSAIVKKIDLYIVPQFEPKPRNLSAPCFP